MKKLYFVLLLALSAFYAHCQFSPIYVSGSVKDLKGNPIPFYTVVINADSSSGGTWTYYNKVLTDSSGLFNLVINPPVGKTQNFWAFTYDCKSNVKDTFFSNATQYINLKFTVCAYIPPVCQAYFYYYADSSGKYDINFINASKGSATKYFWDFGDNYSSTLQNPKHTFSKNGIYSVCLTISDSATGCFDVYCDKLYFGNDSFPNSNCYSTFTYIDTNQTVQFSGYCKSVNPVQVFYKWDFGDGTSGTGQAPVHVYSSAGDYFVILYTLSIDSLNDSCFSKYGVYITVGNTKVNATIVGFVRSATYAVDKALVYLIQFNPKDSSLHVVDSVYAMDSTGTAIFYFGNVPQGEYLVKAALTTASANFSHCLPTYFGNVLFWDKAIPVKVNSQNTSITLDILLISGSNPGGPGFIGGKTTKGANIWEMNGSVSVSNIEILLLDASGNPVLCNYSKSTGDFGFSDLALGTYNLYPEILGIKAVPAVVTIDAQHPSVTDVQIIISEKSIKYSGISDLISEGNLLGMIYPNPASEKIQINLISAKTCKVDVLITNQLGQVVSKTQFDVVTGQNTISTEVNNLARGLYNLIIRTSDGKNISRSFSLIK